MYFNMFTVYYVEVNDKLQETLWPSYVKFVPSRSQGVSWE